MNQESPRTLVLFNYDWDRLGFGHWSAEFPHDHAGFDLKAAVIEHMRGHGHEVIEAVDEDDSAQLGSAVPSRDH